MHQYNQTESKKENKPLRFCMSYILITYILHQKSSTLKPLFQSQYLFENDKLNVLD